MDHDTQAKRGGETLEAITIDEIISFVDGLDGVLTAGPGDGTPGLRLAPAACRAGDTLVGTKLDRLARSLPDARDILHELTKRNIKLSLGSSIHDPTDPLAS